MKNRRSQHRICPADEHTVGEVIECSHTTTCDHRHGDRISDRPRQLQVETFARAVAIHRGEQNFTRAELGGARGPLDGIDAGGGATAVHVDLVAASTTLRIWVSPTLCIDCTHHALAAEVGGDLRNQLGALHGSGVHAHLVGSCPQQRAGRCRITNPTAHRERNEQLLSRSRNNIEHRGALVARRGDVEKHHLVGALGVVAHGEFNGVAGVAQPNKVDTLHHTTISHIKTRDHPRERRR